jgi:hypothetical protein
MQNAMDTIWAVPRHVRPDPFRDRLRSLLLLTVLGSALIATTLFTALGHASTELGGLVKAAIAAAAVLVNAGVCLIAFRVATTWDVGFSQLVPGALTAAVIWQLLQWFGAFYVGHVVKKRQRDQQHLHHGAGPVGVPIPGGADAGVLRRAQCRTRQSALSAGPLTSFTDDVALTRADRTTYTGQAKAQQAKGFEDINVSFDGRGGNATA